MVAIMAVTPVQLLHHGHQLGFVGLAVSVHVLGMFAPSVATGWLAHRVGGAVVAWAGAALLVLAGVGGAVVDHGSGPAMVVVLVLLGLGWNAGVVGGSALLAASVPAELRPRYRSPRTRLTLARRTRLALAGRTRPALNAGPLLGG